MNLRQLIIIILEKLQLARIVRRVVKYKLPYYRYIQWRRLRSVRKRGYANIVFIVANLPMWRSQGIYDFLRKDSRYRLNILISGFESFTKEENEKNISALKEYFKERAMDYCILDELNSNSIMQQWNPDVIFYPQPYANGYPPTIDCTSFKDRLMVYVPYGFMTIFKEWNYNSFLHNYAWRVYYPTHIHKVNAENLSVCKGDNVRIVGEPHADDFINGIPKLIWKDDGSKKRIIWAPHFQIRPNGMFNRPSFNWTCNVMVEIANQYRDKIQFAFKPHPRLYSELCNHPDWGETKTQEYYATWESMPNAQVETGEFIDLFKGSDALIHDCGSFVAEYMFVCKPCMFLTHDEESVEQDMCEFGKKCFHLHNIGHNKDEVIRFIEDTVLTGNDEKHNEREIFFQQYLTPPNNKSTAQNMYEDMCISLFGSL